MCTTFERKQIWIGYDKPLRCYGHMKIKGRGKYDRLGPKNYLTFDLDLWPLHTYIKSVTIVLRYLHVKYKLDMLQHWKDMPRKYEIDIKCNWDDIISFKWNGYLTFDHDLCLWYMYVMKCDIFGQKKTIWPLTLTSDPYIHICNL